MGISRVLSALWFVYNFLPVSQSDVFSNPKCYYPAECLALNDSNTMCLGVKVKYTHTSLSLANDSATLEDVKEKLRAWSGLQGAPKCWDVIQPLLCAVYMPRCENSQVEMYRRDLCLSTKEPCKIVPEANGGEWPSFLDCDLPYFSSDEACTAATYTSMEFTNNHSCMYPLVKTDNTDSFYEDIDGCGIQCHNPFFSSNEHQSVHTFIAVLASACLVSTLLTILTFLIDWRNSKRYPSVIIFFINVCFFMGSVGWLAQFAGPEARDSIVCRRDGTVRLAEPLVGEGKETVTCTVVFFIVYYFMLAGVTWFVILAYSWHVSFKKLQKGSVDDKLQPKIAYFHIIAWTLPLICAIITMSLQKVDGDSLSGICFVGYVDKFARGFLVLFPITLALVSGLFFLLQGVVLLYKVRQCSDGIRNNKAAAKLTTTILRLGIFSTLAFIFVTLTLIIHIYDFNHKDLWEKSFKTYTICKASAKFDLRQDDDSTCEFKYRPNLATIYLNIFSYFGAGIMMSSWTWTKASKETWLRFFRKLLSMPTNKPIKLKSKHKMIALAFQKNQQKKGRKLSLDFHTSHDDPLGMKLEMDSYNSQDMSSDWVQAMPNLVRRRGGVALPVAGTLRRYSDSDISSIIVSRRASIDSQLSGAEAIKRRRRRRGGRERRDHRDLSRVTAADIAAFNAKRSGSGRSRTSIDKVKAHIHRRLSDASTTGISNASAHNISFECEDPAEQYAVSSSRRSSVNSSIAAGLTNTAQLEQLTLATYSMFTASALLPRQHSTEKASLHHSRPSSRKISGRSRQLQTPNTAYVNGALDDAEDELSDISL